MTAPEPDRERDPIDPERWSHIERLLDAALELDPAQWPKWLGQACGDDASLRAEVESLLSRHADAAGYLETSPAEIAARLVSEAGGTAASSPVEGGRVGAYRIVSFLGSGGMGRVYLAERADGAFEQRVALKLLPAGADPDARERRFRAERQILASLEHPHIARLLDGGLTNDGQPYLAMEYVAGRPLDRYCDEEQITVDARLRLFLQVATAVQYAHRNLVVHRDLKPSNILVTSDGDGERVKLLDFGIAKLLDPSAAAMPLTETGTRPMTPEYASPEQVRGEPVTVASDVYQLGLLLYELLTDRRPYRIDGRTPADAERVICTHEPERPSAVVPREPLRRKLRGDLDTIALMALRKEPENRYLTVQALAEDIERHLLGQPVRARGATPGYRLRKFVRRYPLGVVAAATIVVALAGYAATAAAQATRVQRAFERAQIETAKAEQVTRFLMGLFEAGDPTGDGSLSLTARELLDRGFERADELEEQPEVQAELLHILGTVYQNLGQYDQARPLLERALAIRRRLFGAEHVEVARSLNNLGTLLQRRGEYAAAERLHRDALAMRRSLLGSQHEDVAISLNALASTLAEQGNPKLAEPLYQEALAIVRSAHGEEHPYVASTIGNLAFLLHSEGEELDRAESLYRESLALKRKVHGDEHASTAITLNNLAALLQKNGDFDAAVQLRYEVLAMNRKLLGEEHPDIAMSLNNLAYLLEQQQQPEAAEPLYREALAMRRKLLGDEHPATGATLENLALLVQDRGAHQEAEALLRESLAARRATFGEEHPTVADTWMILGRALVVAGRPAEAEPLLRQALELHQRTLANDDWRVARAKSALATGLTELAEYQEAEALLLESYAVFSETKGSAHERDHYTTRSLERLAALYQTWGRADEAAPYRAMLAERRHDRRH